MARSAVLAAAVICMACLSSAANPGFRVQLTNNGLNYAREIGVPILEKLIQSLQIPDISGSADTPVGHIDYTLSNIKATAITLPSSTIASTTPGVVLAMSGVTVDLGADWKYREHHWPHVSDHGSADISTDDTSVSITIAAGITSAFNPDVSVAACSGGVGSLKIKFHGGASWLYNLFDHLIADEVKKSLNKELCAEISNVVTDQVNAELAKIPEKEALDAYAGINFELLQAPNTTNDYLLTSHKGEFYMIKEPTALPPFAPTVMPYPTESTRMFYFYVSAYTVETAGWAYGATGALNYTITPSMVPSSFPIQLNTNSLGKIIPALAKKYPNLPMNLVIEPTTVPVDVIVNPRGANATVYLNLLANVLPNNTASVTAFVLNTTIYTSVDVWVAQNNKSQECVRANLTFLDFDLKAINSTIGPIDVTALDAVINALVTSAILPILNKALESGFPLPIVDGLSFVNPEIVFANDYIYIGTDVNYKPSKAKTSTAQLSSEALANPAARHVEAEFVANAM